VIGNFGKCEWFKLLASGYCSGLLVLNWDRSFEMDSRKCVRLAD